MSGGFDTSPVDHPGLFVAGGETAAPAEFLSLLRVSLQVNRSQGSVNCQGLALHTSCFPICEAGSHVSHAASQVKWSWRI